MKLEGTRALVTGAGRGIGRAVALALAHEGAMVILSARTEAELESVKKEITSKGGKAETSVVDLTDDRSVEKLFEQIERDGGLDLLVNNAGMGRFEAVRSMSLSDFDAMWNLNMRAVFQCSKLALPLMEKNKKGMIVNIASLAGKNAFTGGAGYAATKWALLGFSRCLMLEEREFNIRVVTICPGSVNTSFSPHDAEKAKRILDPQDVADAVLLAATMPARAMISEIDLRPTIP